MSMQSGLYRKHLPDLVRAGEVPQAVLERFGPPGARDQGACSDCSRIRSGGSTRSAKQSRSLLPKNRALARESGRKSIVLLKNEGDLLPLPQVGQDDRADRARSRPGSTI